LAAPGAIELKVTTYTDKAGDGPGDIQRVFYFYSTDTGSFDTGTFTIGQYSNSSISLNTSYPGDPGNLGSILTLVKIGKVTGSANPMNLEIGLRWSPGFSRSLKSYFTQSQTG